MPVDDASDLYELVQDTMAANGYNQYEISNYSKSELLRCKHNLVYWDGYKEYVSFGPSAHEFFYGERSWNLSSIDQYLKRIDANELPRKNSEQPKKDERRTEVLFCGLRSTGIDLDQFNEAFDEDIINHPEMPSLIDEGLLQVTGKRISLTTKGYRYCDAIVIRLMELSTATIV
jgi:oxygen-independent coproporphyrinogen-3 oxidase